MKTYTSIICLLFVYVLNTSLTFAQSPIPSSTIQIETTLLAAPEMYRADAKVIGYNSNGELITLREGNNGIVCLADDPNKKGFNVACYSIELEDYMARGRALIAEGKSEKEKREIRKKEIDDGILKMPSTPAAVYVLSAKEEDYNMETGELENTKLRYVFYKPYMTAEETGLPTRPSEPGMPWLMDPNTHRSHIMITPAP